MEKLRRRIASFNALVKSDLGKLAMMASLVMSCDQGLHICGGRFAFAFEI